MATSTVPTVLQGIEKTALAVVVSVVENVGPGLQPLLVGLLSKPVKDVTPEKTAKIAKLATDLSAILPDLADYYQTCLAA